MKRTKFQMSAVFVALASLSSVAFPMNLLEAYRAAQTQDATILASRAAAEAGRERLPQAESQFLPNISASYGRTNNKLVSTSPNILGQTQTTVSDYPSSNQALTVRQAIFRPQLTAQQRQAKAQTDEAEATLAQEEQNLALRVGGAYFEALLTKEQLDLVLSQRTLYTTQLDAARKSLLAGYGTRTDIDDAQARLDMTYAQEMEARQNVAYTQKQLETLINQPVVELAGLNVSRFEASAPQPALLEEWVARAEARSPQLQALTAQLESARAEIAKSKSGHLPTLDAVAQVTRTSSDSVSNITSKYENTTIGLQLNIPIYSGGYTNSTIRQAVALEQRAIQSLEAGRRDLGVRVFKEFRGMSESVPKIKAYEQALRSADQLVLSSRKSFQAGSRTMLDILNAEQQRMSVVRDLAQARYVYLVSKLRLLALVGDAGDESIAEMNQLFVNP